MQIYKKKYYICNMKKLILLFAITILSFGCSKETIVVENPNIEKTGHTMRIAIINQNDINSCHLSTDYVYSRCLSSEEVDDILEDGNLLTEFCQWVQIPLENGSNVYGVFKSVERNTCVIK